ncbi:type IV pilus twitching motility protein PilT [Synechococcus sp. RSCCF101]|nr:type IV pilus twitching motility protein PilT [Synechococcus sp. RSCCF101]
MAAPAGGRHHTETSRWPLCAPPAHDEAGLPPNLLPRWSKTRPASSPGAAAGAAQTSGPPPATDAAPRPAAPGAAPQTARRDDGPSLQDLVRIADEKGYSDVHLGVGEVPRYRERGEIIPTDWPVTDDATFVDWMKEVLPPEKIDSFLRNKDFDGSYAFPFVRVRINLMDSLLGPAMVLRLIPKEILTMEQLNLPEVLRELASRPKGLVLITGPTGSGKSTTLAAMIDWINRNQSRHILTIEDPVEFVHSSRRSLVRHREVGMHTHKFHNALKASLREDPDVILIGEIRDQETLGTALEASQTGHLVFGTLHTNSAVKTVERVLGMYEPEQQDSVRRSLSESLLGVIAQGLIRTTDGKRAAYHDILVNSDACKDYIQRGELDSVEEIMQRSRFEGMCTANQVLAELVETGKVEPEKALEASLKPNELAQALRGRQ